ncbi:MAG: hypothetical protein DYG94_11785 [Leptolyngbya sp. PLA3]|nr:MAG: hypothetical protein EDM82_13140 [Cyanobacteria bacterium CYA]MCE7969405.1 hypothetical protein [Leptolyngbya sp. PL-A3]
MLIGPGLPAPRVGVPLDDQPSMLIEDARRRLREQDEGPGESMAILKRLVVAFVVVALLAVLCLVVLPRYNVHLPPMVPLLAFVVIVVGALMSSYTPPRKKPRCNCQDEGQPICCPGPRPVRLPPERDQ